MFRATQHNTKTFVKSLIFGLKSSASLSSPLSSVIGSAAAGWGAEDRGVLEQRRRTAGFLLTELEPSHASGQCSDWEEEEGEVEDGQDEGNTLEETENREWNERIEQIKRQVEEGKGGSAAAWQD